MRQSDITRKANSKARLIAALDETGAELIGEFIGANIPVEIRCANGHVSKRIPTSITTRGTGCNVCVHSPSKETEDRFRSLIDRLGGRITGTYVRATHPIEMICPIGHATRAVPANITQRGYIPCKDCKRIAATKIAKSRERFIDALAELGATLVGEYGGTGVPVEICCASGHVNTIFPLNLLRTNPQGICVTCTGRNDTRSAEAKFRECLRVAGATLISSWSGVKATHHVICSAGHDSYPYPDNIINVGKPICSRCSGAWDVFYVVSSPTVVKFGITSRDVRPRLFAHRTNGYRTTHRVFDNMQDGGAIHLERQVKKMLASAGFVPVHGREYFDIRALATILAYVDSHNG